MPFVNSKKEEKEKEKKIEIDYGDMEVENRNLKNKDENQEKTEKKNEVKKMIIIQRKDNILFEKQTPNIKEEKN